MPIVEDDITAEVQVGAGVLEDIILPVPVRPPGQVQALTPAPNLRRVLIPAHQGDQAVVDFSMMDFYAYPHRRGEAVCNHGD